MLNGVASFAMLIHELVEARHGGNVRKMVLHTGIPYPTLTRWEHGEIENPNVHRVAQLCRAYELDLEDVVGLLARDALTRAKGGRPAVPIIKRTPGPAPDPNSKRSHKRFGKTAGAVILALGAWLGIPAPAPATPARAETLSAEILTVKDAAYRRRRRRRWWPSWPWPQRRRPAPQPRRASLICATTERVAA